MQPVYWRWDDLKVELEKLHRHDILLYTEKIIHRWVIAMKDSSDYTVFNLNQGIARDDMAQKVANKLQTASCTVHPVDILQGMHADLVAWAVSEIIRTERMSAFNALKETKHEHHPKL